MRAEASGFKAFVEKNIPKQVNENRRAVSESISVTSQLAQVETREGVLKAVIEPQRIVELPLNGRNPLQLQYLVAGIGGRSGGGGGQAQNQVVPINGQRGNANNYTLDGGDNHGPFFSTPSLSPGIFGAGPPGATLDQRRPLYPLFCSDTNVLSAANSTYHALQATFNKRFSHGFTVLANYT